MAILCLNEFDHLRGRRLFITGGTGFLGRTLLDYLSAISTQPGNDLKVDVLSRDPSAFLKKFPQYANQDWLSFIEGSLDKLPSSREHYTDLIHGAADTHWAGDKLTWLEQLVDGTHQVLAFAKRNHVRRLVFLSSGAVYGPRHDCTPLEEDQPQAPITTDISKIYGHGKRMAETICALYSSQYNLPCIIARCFAVISEHVPLDGPYAIGNFLRDALDPNRPAIVVRGTGEAIRTYIDGRDMACWLLTMLERGAPGTAYNLGGARTISTLALAELVGRIASKGKRVQVEKQIDLSSAADRSIYVPSLARAKLLGLTESVALEESIAWVAEKLKTQGRVPASDG